MSIIEHIANAALACAIGIGLASVLVYGPSLLTR